VEEDRRKGFARIAFRFCGCTVQEYPSIEETKKEKRERPVVGQFQVKQACRLLHRGRREAEPQEHAESREGLDNGRINVELLDGCTVRGDTVVGEVRKGESRLRQQNVHIHKGF